MAAPSKAVSQTFAYSAAATESHFSSNEYYSTIVVDNATGEPLNVCTDGGTAVAGAGTDMLTVPAGQCVAFGNLQPLPNANVPGTDRTASIGWDVQNGYVGTNLTYCSVIPQASATGEVTISFQ